MQSVGVTLPPVTGGSQALLQASCCQQSMIVKNALYSIGLTCICEKLLWLMLGIVRMASTPIIRQASGSKEQTA
jgi:hypothetical protein